MAVTVFGAILAVLLGLPLRLLPGVNLENLTLYLDAAHRIANGQTAGSGFSLPAGPASFYLAYGLMGLFPSANPMLVTQWSALMILLPPLAIIALDIDRTSRTLSYLLLLPFLLFAAIPANSAGAMAGTWFNASGIASRHSGLALYLLLSALLLGRNRWSSNVAALCALVFLGTSSVPAFSAGVTFIVVALATGHISLRSMAAILLATVVTLGAIDAANGAITAASREEMARIMLNRGLALRGYWDVLTSSFSFVVAAVLVAILALRAGRSSGAGKAADPSSESGSVFLLAAIAAGTIFEMYLEAAQDFIWLSPAILLVASRPSPGSKIPIVICAALAIASPLAPMIQQGARVAWQARSLQAITLPEIGPLGRLAALPADVALAGAWRDAYARHKEDYRKAAQKGIDLSSAATSQAQEIAALIDLTQAVRALRAYEQNTGRRFETLQALDRTNPFPFLLERKPLPGVNVLFDPDRTIPPLDPRGAVAISRAEAILVPQCPVTPVRETLLRIYRPALEGRQRIALTPCWDIYIRAGSDFASTRNRAADTGG